MTGLPRAAAAALLSGFAGAIQALSGKDQEVYIDKRILRPLGMHRSYFDLR
jgi:CubicO group peptidase (beta-lactamase class C family)